MPNNNAPKPSNAKTAELWNALYRWATAVLPKKVKVVKAIRTWRASKGTFICINYAGELEPRGLQCV